MIGLLLEMAAAAKATWLIQRYGEGKQVVRSFRREIFSVFSNPTTVT